MKLALLMLAHFALPIALVGFGLFALFSGEGSSAGICILLGVLAAGYKVIE